MTDFLITIEAKQERINEPWKYSTAQNTGRYVKSGATPALAVADALEQMAADLRETANGLP